MDPFSKLIATPVAVFTKIPYYASYATYAVELPDAAICQMNI